MRTAVPKTCCHTKNCCRTPCAETRPGLHAKTTSRSHGGLWTRCSRIRRSRWCTSREPGGRPRLGVFSRRREDGPARWSNQLKLRPALSKGERVDVNARIEELDREHAVLDRAGLANDLVEPLVGDRSIALLVYVHAMVCAGRLAVHKHAEANWSTVRSGPEDDVQVSGVEGEINATRRFVEDGCFWFVRPVAGQRPLVQLKVPWGRVGVSLIMPQPQESGSAFGEVARTGVTDIGFRRLDLSSVGGLFHSFAIDLHVSRGHCVAALLQKLLNLLLRLLVVSFAEVVGANAASGVDEIVRGPVFVTEGFPYLVVAVEGDGIGDLEVVHGALDVRLLFLKGELRSVYPDDDKSVVLVLGVPGAGVGERAQAVDAGIGPEIDQNNFT